MKKHVLASMVAAATMSFFTPLTSHAFGLGKIEVKSALNEPFKAEIGLTALRPEEKDNLQVKVASEDEFKRAGLDRSLLLSQLQFDIIERGGQDKILVTTKQAIKEPFLDFLITATAGSGVLIREYTVLLDPPAYVMAETRSTTSTAATEAPAPAESQATTTRYQYGQSSGFNGSSYDVKRSDTLWNIALQTRPSSNVSVHQMMMALLRANPQAFSNNNVNGLRAGVTLQIPAQDEITSLSKAQAQAAFAEQTAAWRNRHQAATTVTQTDTTSETQPEQESSTEQTAEGDTAEKTVSDSSSQDAATAAGSASAETDARLQLVAPEEDVTSEDDAQPNVEGDDEIKRLTEQLTLAQETIEAQTQENVDFKARMDAMEEQLETMRRLISLKDADLARLQSLLEDDDPALAAEAASALQRDTQDMGTAVATEPAAEDMTMAADETAAQTVDTAEPAAADMSEQQADDIVAQTAQALNLDQQQVQSTVDKVKQFVMENKLPVALGLLLILLLLWLMARRSSREVTWDEAVKKMDKDDHHDSPAATVVAPVRDEPITDAPLADEQPEQEKSVAELVEQADMFVGYADYVQARSSLEQARAIEPNNTLVAYKMLFVLYKQNQVEEFVELAEAVPFETDSLEWHEVKQWGRELAPDNTLFQDQPAAQSDQFVAASDDSAKTDEPAATDDVAEAETAEDNHLEFNLNDFAEPSPTEAEAESDTESEVAKRDVDDDLLAFDSNYGVGETVKQDNSEEPLEIDITDEADDDNTLSFDEATESDSLNIEPEALDASEDSADNADEPDLEFDIGDLDDIDEAETKLDLAAAYIDMGDPDGARSILNEVLVEGSTEQKDRAQELLNSL